MNNADMPASPLPAPRLQLRWCINSGANSVHEYLCHYELVMPLREHDMRREVYDDDGIQTGEISELVIPIRGPTKRGADHDPCVDMLGRRFYDEPYRDGSHAKWDSEALGGLPIFVIPLDGKAIRRPSRRTGARAVSADTLESIRLAVYAMATEWDDWAEENKGTHECFEASLRAALAQLQLSPDPVRDALVDALTSARDYITSELARERDTFMGHENCSDIPAIERDLARTDAALRAAGVEP